MDDQEDTEEVPCLCRGFVPEEYRVDFIAVRPNPKTGKPHWKTVMRYHKDCPEHGIHPCLAV